MDDTFTSCYTVTNFESRTARNGHHYLRLMLENAYESATANCWHGSYIGPESFSIGDIVRISGRRKILDFRELVDIHQASLLKPRGEDVIISIPRSTAPNPNDLVQLISIAKSIGSGPLKEFIFEAFGDQMFAQAFISLPASQNHHHHHPGGLLRHSLECVETVQSCVRQKDHRDIATVAALFHDAGKVLTMKSNGKTPLGYMVDHDSLTLECLSGPLANLDTSWPDAGIALRHIWTCRSRRRWGFAARTYLADVVQLADRISAETDAEQQAFAELPSWRNHAMHPVSEQRFWRPAGNLSETFEPEVVMQGNVQHG